MRFTRRMAIISLSLTLSMFGLGQLTLGDSAKGQQAEGDNSGSHTSCPGGTSQKFRLGGQVEEHKTFTLSDLQSLPASKVTVTFQTGKGQETHTYIGVPLWQIIESSGGLKPNPSVKNNLLRQYVAVEATDCYEAIVSVGEIEPNFEGKQVLIAYAEEDPSDGQKLLSDEGFARLVVPGDQAGGRYVSNVRRIVVLSAPDLSSKSHH